jgi:hypothetical protein
MENELVFDPTTHEYFLNGAKIPGVTSILQNVGIIDLSGIPYTRLEAAREFGIAVHSACELYDLDDLNEHTLDNHLRPYLDAWISFKHDTDFEIVEVEKPVCSARYRFAGTPDRVGRLDYLTIPDIKSTAELSPAIGIQTGAYEIAWNETHEEKVKQRIGVLLQPNGKYKIEPHKDRNDLNIFLAALSVYNWKRGNLK